MRTRQNKYSEAELSWLRVNCTLPIHEYTQQFCTTFSRHVQPKNLKELRKYRGWRTGRTGRFEKGNTAAMGKKTGKRHGYAAQIYKPIWAERINTDGFVERKIHDGSPTHTRWKLVHYGEWEAIYGPVPDGMLLKCKGDKLNTDPSNWDLISKTMMPRLNGWKANSLPPYDDAPADLKPAIMAVAKLEHQVRVVKKRAYVRLPSLPAQEGRV